MQEIIIDNSVTNYDKCYLKAMELASDYIKTVNRPSTNSELWIYKEIKDAVEYYHKKVMG